MQIPRAWTPALEKASHGLEAMPPNWCMLGQTSQPAHFPTAQDSKLPFSRTYYVEFSIKLPITVIEPSEHLCKIDAIYLYSPLYIVEKLRFGGGGRKSPQVTNVRSSRGHPPWVLQGQYMGTESETEVAESAAWG